MKKECEMVKYRFCLGCVGLAEEDWQGKWNCKYYKELRDKIHGNKNPVIVQK